MVISSYRNGTPAGRRYVIRTFAFMIPYALICVAAMGGVFDELIGRPAGWALAAVVSAPVLGQIWATLSLMRESDEFVRAVVAKQFILASGIAMAGATLGVIYFLDIKNIFFKILIFQTSIVDILSKG